VPDRAGRRMDFCEHIAGFCTSSPDGGDHAGPAEAALRGKAKGPFDMTGLCFDLALEQFARSQSALAIVKVFMICTLLCQKPGERTSRGH
jgi:hypothetical protein